jgi:hypothetical protein
MNMEVTLPGQDEDDEGGFSSFDFEYWTDPMLHLDQFETTDLPMGLDAEGSAALPSDTTSYAFQPANDNLDLLDSAFLDNLLPTESHEESRPL